MTVKEISLYKWLQVMERERGTWDYTEQWTWTTADYVLPYIYCYVIKLNRMMHFEIMDLPGIASSHNFLRKISIKIFLNSHVNKKFKNMQLLNHTEIFTFSRSQNNFSIILVRVQVYIHRRRVKDFFHNKLPLPSIFRHQSLS